MRILWLCNIILPSVAGMLNLKPSNKEGWLSGICDAVKQKKDFELGVCFPVPREFDGFFEMIDGISYYGFWEDTAHPEKYDEGLEKSLLDIVEDFKPDVVHIFGTEYPHTLAMCRIMKEHRNRVLVGIQGILEIYKDHYFDGLPQRVIDRVTFRDFLKKDSLKKQQEKYALRAKNEVEAVKLAGNFTGRTPFDKNFVSKTNPEARYFFMNETLRKEFYEGCWSKNRVQKHSIFLSQGNYPIKGLHTMLEAVNLLKKKYDDIQVYVAGDVITAHKSLKEKIKISSYGKYILELIRKYSLESNVVFTGGLDAKGIKEKLLSCSVFVCPSSIENSPNSLGEAMILGTPCVCSNVGGVPGIFNSGKDGLMFENTDFKGLSDCVENIWSNDVLADEYSKNASEHARITHDPGTNYQRLLDIYGEITECK